MGAPQAVLDRLFPETATIEEPANAQEVEEGQLERMWTAVHADVPSQFSPVEGTSRDTEVRTGAGEFARRNNVLHLLGDLDITEEMRCITRGVTYDVVAVFRDSYRLVTTLHIEERQPTEEESS
jgi:hypothetical protein